MDKRHRGFPLIAVLAAVFALLVMSGNAALADDGPPQATPVAADLVSNLAVTCSGNGEATVSFDYVFSEDTLVSYGIVDAETGGLIKPNQFYAIAAGSGSDGHTFDTQGLDSVYAEISYGNDGIVLDTDPISGCAPSASTDTPTTVPTDTPTEVPTDTPTEVATDTPTTVPTDTPTDVATDTPTEVATEVPTDTPVVPPPTGGNGGGTGHGGHHGNDGGGAAVTTPVPVAPAADAQLPNTGSGPQINRSGSNGLDVLAGLGTVIVLLLVAHAFGRKPVEI